MFSYSIIKSSRWLFIPSYFSRYLIHTNQLIRKNFDKKIFDYLFIRRLEIFNGDKNVMSNHIYTNLESIFKTSSIINYLINLNSKNQIKNFSQIITIEQFNDILFFA